MTPRGRHWVAFWLVFFLAVMGAIVARQTASFVANEQLRSMQETHRSLESTRNALVRRIQTARSRVVLSERARRLGLRAAADSEVVDLRVTGDGRR